MKEDGKQRVIDGLCEDAAKYDDGYWVTIDALTNNPISYEFQITRLFNWTNEYCFGRQYKRGLKRFRVFGAFEVGGKNERLHGHYLLLHKNETNRSFYETNYFIRRKWVSPISTDTFIKLVKIEGNVRDGANGITQEVQPGVQI